MAMIKCPECGASISDQAVSCPHCGYPLNQTANEVSTTVSSSAQQAWDVVLVDYAGSEFNACIVWRMH
ncbi:MAG: zinc ribbon domain-containing protein [Solobacterium sp.]|jgi:predicted amidophosphoribosyltransferase|nr:zinc ribbon domain-containing protein [Solobacterium sp.]MCH4222058.1 zinc ribbon domain-containing protein [Solobacterium sp.]MCH4265720.1 zinc ribbon domain-containing protein [Solobacterium sp.]